ncbi:MAG: hypothetical protein GX872_03760 [Firmicutes bacterium]|nr:hypothetical protein [Bacillota bacterium]
MRIKVRYLSMLDGAVGTATEEHEIKDGARACELLELLVEMHGERLRQLIYSPDGRIVVSCLRNGRSISYDAKLADGDEISLVLLLPGG